MVTKILQMAALCTLLGGGAFGAYEYRGVHVPEFQELKKEVLYWKCMQECDTTCINNGIMMPNCNCSHCRKYIED